MSGESGEFVDSGKYCIVCDSGKAGESGKTGDSAESGDFA